MNDIIEQTDSVDLSGTTQTTDATTESERRVAAYELGFADAAECIIETLRECPAWCNDHVWPIHDWADHEAEWHRFTIATSVGTLEIVLEEQGPELFLPQAEALTLTGAAEVAEAIRTALADLKRLS